MSTKNLLVSILAANNASVNNNEDRMNNASVNNNATVNNNASVNNNEDRMNTNTVATNEDNMNNIANEERRGLLLLTVPPVESLALLMVAAKAAQASKIEVLGQGVVTLSQEVFFSDTTPAHGEFRELIEAVMARAEEIIAAPVTSMRGVDPQVVARQKFYVNNYFNVDARPKKAVEWCSEIEDLQKKMLSALNWTFVQAWQYLDKTERAQLVWRQLDIHFMALSVYFRDYADYSMNELLVGKIARIGLAPTSWDLREDNFEFGFEVSGVQGPVWQAYDKAACIKMWLAGTLSPDVLVRCSNSFGFAQLSPHRALPWAYRPYFR
jgi:hypothetical protein